MAEPIVLPILARISKIELKVNTVPNIVYDALISLGISKIELKVEILEKTSQILVSKNI